MDSLRDDEEGFKSWETFVCWRDDDKGIGPDECGCTLCSEGGIADVEEDAGEEDGESTNSEFRQAAQAQIASKDAEIRALQTNLNQSKQESKLLALESEDEMMRRERISFAAVYFIICVMVIVDQVPGIFSSISSAVGHSSLQEIPCTVSKILLVPLYKVSVVVTMGDAYTLRASLIRPPVPSCSNMPLGMCVLKHASR